MLHRDQDLRFEDDCPRRVAAQGLPQVLRGRVRRREAGAQARPGPDLLLQAAVVPLSFRCLPPPSASVDPSITPLPPSVVDSDLLYISFFRTILMTAPRRWRRRRRPLRKVNFPPPASMAGQPRPDHADDSAPDPGDQGLPAPARRILRRAEAANPSNLRQRDQAIGGRRTEKCIGTHQLR